jgi:hypothetical protein
MSTFIAFAVVSLVALCILRPKWTGARVRHEIEFLKKRNELFELSRELEDKLLDSTFTAGSPVHDTLFKVIQHIKYRERYISHWMMCRLLFTRPSAKAEARWNDIQTEIKKSPFEIKHLSERLFETYTALLFIRHWKLFLFLGVIGALKGRTPITSKVEVMPAVERLVATTSA